MSEADSVSTYRKVLDQLGGGDDVHPVEEMRGQAMTLIEELLGLDAVDVAADSKTTLGPPLEAFLAIALPLIGHGGEPGKRTVVGALQATASETGSSEGQTKGDVLTLALHHLVLLTVTYALAHDRTDLLPALTSIALPNQYDGGQEQIFEHSPVRHAAIFGGGAGQTFESARELFLASELRAEIPYLRRDQDFNAALSEAELISAMCLADRRAGARTTYCHVIGSEGTAERRLRARIRHESANDLALLFEVEPSELNAALNELYATLQGDGMWATPHGPLIRVEQ